MTQVALVTGGSGGIGRACVEALASNHDVVVNYYSNEEAATSIVDEITADPDLGTAIPYRCDVSDRTAVEEMVETVGDELGDISVLVNNAAVSDRKDFFDVDEASIDRKLAVNVKGTIFPTLAVLPGMLEAGKGNIVNVASTAGTRGIETDVVYGMTKAAMVNFTKSIARLYTSDGVFTNAVAPSVTDTPMQPSEVREWSEDLLPIDRLLRPDEIAEVVRLFAMTESISGKVLEIDGGLHT
jgi:NAD(P)-dependent dehydrogenase (short-subunit alcohol dehydrogenase family)